MKFVIEGEQKGRVTGDRSVLTLIPKQGPHLTVTYPAPVLPWIARVDPAFDDDPEDLDFGIWLHETLNSRHALQFHRALLQGLSVDAAEREADAARRQPREP